MSNRRSIEEIGEDDGAYEFLKSLSEEELRPTLTQNSLERGSPDFNEEERKAAWLTHRPD